MNRIRKPQNRNQKKKLEEKNFRNVKCCWNTDSHLVCGICVSANINRCECKNYSLTTYLKAILGSNVLCTQHLVCPTPHR